MSGTERATATDVARRFSEVSGLGFPPESATMRRSDGDVVILRIARPTERLYEAIAQVSSELADDHPYKDRIVLVRRKHLPANRIAMPETQALRSVLSQSLTVDRHSFETNFFERYVRSVAGVEAQIAGDGNHLIYGRRGAGKSSLLAYAMHRSRQHGNPFAWVDLQTYTGQGSRQFIILSVIGEIFAQLPLAAPQVSALRDRLAALETEAGEDLTDNQIKTGIDRLTPMLRRTITDLGVLHGRVHLYLDDLHVLPNDAQALLLDRLYSLVRGNRVWLKVSGIEQFTHAWDPESRQGLESPGDASIIRLDYNLTMPHKSLVHIESILDAHASYCGLPGVRSVCGQNVLERLMWVAAAVPRDAMDIFSKAITNATIKDQKRVSVTSINESISEATTSKERFIAADASGETGLHECLQRVIRFCKDDKRKNAFLVEIVPQEPEFRRIESLVALRMLHVLHEGITPHKAGRRYMALMLDYGFYVGIRAARSVDLFQKISGPLQAKQLRSLPIYSLHPTDE